MSSFFFRELKLIAVLLLICDSYRVEAQGRVPKTVCGIFHFELAFFLLKFIFLFYKMHGVFDYKTL